MQSWGAGILCFSYWAGEQEAQSWGVRRLPGSGTQDATKGQDKKLEYNNNPGRKKLEPGVGKEEEYK